ncbi:MAG: DNA-directed RNA polymerase subunit H [Halobacteria archaeon]|nr:DNA-directed RNA polymerase subunit H [Halobacteria archaeon]
MSTFNVTDHDMAPEHILLDEDEVEEVLERYDLEKPELPKIRESDAGLSNLDAEVGDVIKIVRESWTTDRAVTYRLVIED